MSRVVHVRVYGLADDERPAFREQFEQLVQRREWRAETPWLADADSSDFFSQLYFGQLSEFAEADPIEDLPLSAAAYLHIGNDEFDALALLFMLRDLSEHFRTTVRVSDPDHPIAKLREIELCDGDLPTGAAMESILITRPIFKKLSDGERIEFRPPGMVSQSKQDVDDCEEGSRSWGVVIGDIRATAPDFFEAEAEALRIYNGFRFFRK